MTDLAVPISPSVSRPCLSIFRGFSLLWIYLNRAMVTQDDRISNSIFRLALSLCYSEFLSNPSNYAKSRAREINPPARRGRLLKGRKVRYADIWTIPFVGYLTSHTCKQVSFVASSPECPLLLRLASMPLSRRSVALFHISFQAP